MPFEKWIGRIPFPISAIALVIFQGIRYTSSALVGIVIITTLTGCCFAQTSGEDVKNIQLLLKQLYAQNARTFLKIGTADTQNQRIAYYTSYFENSCAIKMVTAYTMSPESLSIIRDPRVGKAFASDSDPDWYKYVDFSYKFTKIIYSTPQINGNNASVSVDSVLDGDSLENRSLYHLSKHNNTWKINNITWGPKRTFEEGSKQLIYTLFD